MRKYCRICWNTRNWREPTAEASKLEKGDSYVRSHGFGHEEWLFNFQWVQPAGSYHQVNYKYSLCNQSENTVRPMRANLQTC